MGTILVLDDEESELDKRSGMSVSDISSTCSLTASSRLSISESSLRKFLSISSMSSEMMTSSPSESPQYDDDSLDESYEISGEA